MEISTYILLFVIIGSLLGVVTGILLQFYVATSDLSGASASALKTSLVIQIVSLVLLGIGMGIAFYEYYSPLSAKLRDQFGNVKVSDSAAGRIKKIL